MRRLRIAALAAASVAAATTLGTIGFAGQALAGGHEIKCASFTGSVSSNTVTLAGCNGNTGGGGTLMVSTLASGSGPINWANGDVTNVSVTFSQLPAEHGCPSKSDSEFTVSGVTTSDNTGSAAPPKSKVKGKACLGGSSGDNNTISNKGHLKV